VARRARPATTAIGAQTRSARDLYVVETTGETEAVLANLPLAGSVAVSSFQWATQGPWLFYSTSAGTSAVVDAANASAVALPSNLNTFAWVPGQASLLANSFYRVMLVDATAPSETPLQLSEANVTRFSMDGPNTPLVYFRELQGLMLDDLLGNPAPRTNMGFGGGDYGVFWKWSRDSRFLAAMMPTFSRDRLYMVRTEGYEASSPIGLHGESVQPITMFWQP
jgi:hypothetical protein